MVLLAVNKYLSSQIIREVENSLKEMLMWRRMDTLSWLRGVAEEREGSTRGHVTTFTYGYVHTGL